MIVAYFFDLLPFRICSKGEYQCHKSRRYNCVSFVGETLLLRIDYNRFVHFFIDSVVPKEKSRGSEASVAAADDVGNLSSLAVTANQDVRREVREDFVFVTPKGVIQSRKTNGTPSAESFISCDTASVSTIDGVSTKAKRKRVRKRKKNSVAEIAQTSDVDVATESTVATRPNPFQHQPIAAKSNTHVRYVFTLLLVYH